MRRAFVVLESEPVAFLARRLEAFRAAGAAGQQCGVFVEGEELEGAVEAGLGGVAGGVAAVGVMVCGVDPGVFGGR
jgi:hypothetical protein